MEVSRLAIATWASHTWVFDSTNFLPPMRPRSQESGQDSFADQLPFELGQRRRAEQFVRLEGTEVRRRGHPEIELAQDRRSHWIIGDNPEDDMTRAEISRATELARACMTSDYQDCGPRPPLTKALAPPGGGRSLTLRSGLRPSGKRTRTRGDMCMSLPIYFRV